MDQDRAAAAHVAGHGVVGELMGFECLARTIRWTDQHLGVCRWPAMPETVFQQLQFQWIDDQSTSQIPSDYTIKVGNESGQGV